MEKKVSKRKLRLAIIVTAEVTAATFVDEFANYVANHGYDVTIIADGIEPSYQKRGQGTLSTIPIAIKRDPHPLSDLRSLFVLVRQLKRLDPDILTFATPKASLLGSIAGAILRIPIRVYQLWGLRLETVHQLPKKTILAMSEKLTSILSTKIVANSHSLAAKYQDLGLNIRKTVDTLGQGSSHGVDIERFSTNASFPPLDKTTEQRLNEKPNRLTVGFVGRLHPDKGIDTLLDAVRLVKNGGVPVNLVLIGSDEGAALDLTGELEGDTIVVGRVKDTRPYFAALDILILPSLREGFPNVVLEAAAMSVPAIVSDATGVIDSVVHEVTGLIVPVQDADSLANAIVRLHDDSELRKRLGAAARHRVEEQFSNELVWKRTLFYLTGNATGPEVNMLETAQENRDFT